MTYEWRKIKFGLVLANTNKEELEVENVEKKRHF